MREEDGPVIAEVVMQLEISMGGFDLKVGNSIPKSKAWHCSD